LLAQAQHRAINGLGTDPTMAGHVGSGATIVAIYPLYIYCNFSGYIDVVIGVARFFRIALPENFDRPFASENFIGFWGRWHMTLSGWLRTYVYNPLMMACVAWIGTPRRTPYLGVLALFVTFFLVGLWHGQTSEFLFFGFLQGGGVAANKLYEVLMQDRLGRKAYRALAANPLYRTCSRGLTFTWFAFTLLWFWSTWPQIAGFAATLGPLELTLVWISILAAATLILAGAQAAHNASLRLKWKQKPVLRSRYVRTAWNTAVAVVTVAMIALLQSPAPDIVYKAF
jgi:alginate O-acetyltransferase complex protein AlgI